MFHHAGSTALGGTTIGHLLETAFQRIRSTILALAGCSSPLHAEHARVFFLRGLPTCVSHIVHTNHMGSGSSSSVRTLFGTLITKCTCWLFDTEKIRSGDDLRSVGACGATQSWTTLDEEKIATLDDIDTACAADPCADCGEFEVGVSFESLKSG